MVSRVAIANRALGKLGAERIISLSDQTKPARVMNDCFQSLLEAQLRAHYWNFSKARASLAEMTSPPDWGYAYQYLLPSDCLRVIQVNELYIPAGLADYITGDASPYSVEGRKILTNFSAPLKIRYIQRVDDSNLFDPLFVELLACKLAWENAEELTQSDTKKKTLASEYQDTLRHAIRANAIELPPQPLPDESHYMGRIG